MQGSGTTVVELTLRPSNARPIFGYALLLAFSLTGCGIGELDRGGKRGGPNTASAQSQMVSDAYKKRVGSVAALPKGGPGAGAAPKRTPTPASSPSARSPNDTTSQNKSFRARLVSFFKGPKRNRATGDDEQVPAKIRGRYAMSDSGDFFVPCNDTTRYMVQGTTEARYLMVERLRFIVRGLKTPVYAVFTGIYVAPKKAVAPDPATQPRENKSSTPTAGMRSPSTTPAPLARKAIFVNKVDTLTTSFPNACRPPTSNRSAGG